MGGAVAHGFAVHLQDVDPGRLVDTRVDGDLVGPARLEIEPADGGERSVANLMWAVEVHDPVLRSAALVARPLMEWGHDRVVRAGVAQFRWSALPDGGTSPDPGRPAGHP